MLETLVLQQTLLDGSKDRIICGVFLHFVLRDGAFSINPHVGGYVFDPDSGLKHRPVYGAGFGYNISERWMAEAVLDYVDTEFESGLDMDVFNYRLDGLYHFRPDKKFVPYLAFGAGAITYKPALGRRDTDPLINYGIGAKYFLTQAMALRGDMRHVLSFGDTQNNFVYSLGLTFFFGGERRAAPAAESAVPETAGIFVDAIKSLSLEDAKGILQDPDDAATRYFREQSEASLTRAILPIVEDATAKTGVTAAYKKLTGGVALLGQLSDSDSLDIDGYVTRKALDGLFLKLAEEEKLIRQDPLARSTELLKKVFGTAVR